MLSLTALVRGFWWVLDWCLELFGVNVIDEGFDIFNS